MTQHLIQSIIEDGEVFSTPPLSPEPTAQQLSLSRKNSRPTSLLLDRQRTKWMPDIQVTTSPDFNKTAGVLSPPMLSEEKTVMPTPASQHPRPHELQKAVTSPCFVHSHLDKGMLTDWFKNQSHPADNNDVGLAKSLQHPEDGITPDLDDEFQDELGNSLTKHLAETAVAVRDMSKQLGRARIQSHIQTVLIVTKARDNRLIKLTRQLALYLMQKRCPGSTRGLVVYVDSQLRRSRRFDAEGLRRDHPELFQPLPKRSSSVHSLSSVSSKSTHTEYNDDGQLRYWTSSMCRNSPHWFDFVVTLGGDGTVLFTSWLFQRIVPPVLPFALGSLGFLTNFNFSDHEAVMDSAIDNGIRVNLRMRFTCTVYRAVVNEETRKHKAVRKGNTGEIMMKNLEKGGWEALEAGLLHAEKPNAKDKEIVCFTTRPVETFEVLNDLVVDRGPSPYVSLLELFGDEHHMTTVQADGLTVATPTGSTAYSLSAGGSLVHPEIPAILITPICPHTLSFRPMLLPDTLELRICVPYNSRSTAWASFDGRGRVELKQGDHIKVTASKYPFPTVCADKQSTDWFHAISRTLKWNERERQKSFVVVEEDVLPVPRKRAKRKVIDTPAPASTENIEDGEEDEHSEEEEEKFDIDDSAPEADTTSIAERITLMDKVTGIEKTKRKHALARLSRSRSRQRTHGLTSPPASGVASPIRYATMPPHPPAGSLRHVGFNVPKLPSSSTDSLVSDVAQEGMRDDLRSPRVASGKSRIPVDRELETPTAGTHHHYRGRSFSQLEPRAFAVRGKDESDSTASDA